MNATKEAERMIQPVTQKIQVMHPADFSQYHIGGGKYVAIDRDSGSRPVKWNTSLILLQSEFNPLFKKWAYRRDHLREKSMLVLELSLLPVKPADGLKNRLECVYLSDFETKFENPLLYKTVKACSADFSGLGGDTFNSKFTGELDVENAALLEKIVMQAKTAPMFRVKPKEFVYCPQ